MNDEANPRSLAFQMKDLSEHCRTLASMPSGPDGRPPNSAGWKKRRPICFTRTSRSFALRTRNGVRALLDELLSGMEGELPNFSDAITHAYFSHAEELERAT